MLAHTHSGPVRMQRSEPEDQVPLQPCEEVRTLLEVVTKISAHFTLHTRDFSQTTKKNASSSLMAASVQVVEMKTLLKLPGNLRNTSLCVCTRSRLVFSESMQMQMNDGGRLRLDIA